MDEALRTYLQAVEREYQTGIAAEHAYRPALERLLEAIENGLNAVNDPKRSAIGAPDFQVLRGQTTIGFVEAKDINISLDRVEKSEQMQRYLRGLGNLILTDYLEFRWYVKGQHQQTVRIAAANGRIRADKGQFDSLAHILRSFIQVIVPTTNTAQELAVRMAANAHLIRDLIYNDLESEDPSSSLVVQRDAFKKTLLPDIDNAQFADMYAQTISYGLFAARVNYKGEPKDFTRRGAGEDIPRTNPFLRKLFINIGLDLGDRVTFLVDVLADLLAHTDMTKVLKDFGHATQEQKDPVVHFYETFLREYDPHLREKRGVYYTPEPVVSYIVRSVDYLLRERFGRQDGLADTDTLILDPATGTGTFLYFVMEQIYKTGFSGQAGIWNSYVREHLLRRIFGFELLMAPYAVAHMKLGLLLNERGYTFGSKQRLSVYLTNTLEEAAKSSETLFAQFISEEANEASAVKRDKKIMVVLGNPPYSGHSANKGEWITKLHREYYFVDGQRLGERNTKWLQNDYIKFIRFGQWRISKTGSGILAFITDNSYLDSPTMRGMRQQLMHAFTDIYILNLHGNGRKKEKTPEGGTDENVFDIEQGVAIAVFVKDANPSLIPTHGENAKIHYADLWGLREEKYLALLQDDMNNTGWQMLAPEAPFYMFVPQNLDLKDEYEPGWKITEILPLNSVGVVTGQDTRTIAYTMDEARKLARQHNISEQVIEPILYRPFDIRSIVYDPEVVTRRRFNTMRHLLDHKNMALITSRMTKGEIFQHVQVTTNIVEVICMSPKTSNNGFVFPLYLYPDPNESEPIKQVGDKKVKQLRLTEATQKFYWPLSDEGRRPNLNPDFVAEIAEKLHLEFVTDGQGDLENTFGPEDVFAYAYAILHSPTYRERYAEFLKTDFPRLPLTSDVNMFQELVAKGSELVDLHLMRSSALGHLVTIYPTIGDNQVASGYPKFTEADQKVWINQEQYFEGVTEEIWEFQVGGYQVLDKWLKDRRGRTLSYDDIRHYQRIVVALQETIRLMDEIDEVIPAWPIE